MRILENIKPENVMRFFEDICAIPHGSGDTKKISEYCIDTARKMGLEAVRDDMNNVIIKKAASSGYEGLPAVILQAHLDMVCEKTPDCNIDFLTDGIPLTVDGDYITAKGTTLGGDDGIGVAMILAILEDNTLKHPPIGALFTTDEETGMFGAAALDGSMLSGRTMINIDSENEGVLTVSCAGGARSEIRIPTQKIPVSSPCYEIVIEGLKGGHSGVEIHKGRHNSNLLMGRLLNELTDSFNIIAIDGGNKDNAIPARTVCRLATNANFEKLKAFAADFEETHRTAEEPCLKITVLKIKGDFKAIDADGTAVICKFLSLVPNGVVKMSEDIKGLVQTSLNLGVLKTKEDEIYLTISVRSSVNDEKTALLNNLDSLTEQIGGSIEHSGDYPAWEYRKNSPLRDVMVSEFKAMYGREPVVEAIHAGLECGLLSDKLPGLDAVSFGPDMEEIHTPNEKLSIPSVERTYNYLCRVLSNLKNG